MDEEFSKQLCDRFEGFELIELLNIPIEDVVEAFRDKIEEQSEFLLEYVIYGR